MRPRSNSWILPSLDIWSDMLPSNGIQMRCIPLQYPCTFPPVQVSKPHSATNTSPRPRRRSQVVPRCTLCHSSTGSWDEEHSDGRFGALESRVVVDNGTCGAHRQRDRRDGVELKHEDECENGKEWETTMLRGHTRTSLFGLNTLSSSSLPPLRNLTINSTSRGPTFPRTTILRRSLLPFSR